MTRRSAPTAWHHSANMKIIFAFLMVLGFAILSGFHEWFEPLIAIGIAGAMVFGTYAGALLVRRKG